MSNRDKELCLNCVFWLPDPVSVEKELSTRRGFCRRYPPVTYGTKFQNPTTRGTQWCGDWEWKDEE